MKIYGDSFFHIGSYHLANGDPCQDYSEIYNSDDLTVAFVADGCSGGRRTDIGSRMLALSLLKSIKEYWQKNKDISSEMIKMVEQGQKIILSGASNALGLETEDLLATCMYIVAGEKNMIVRIIGDGVLVKKYIDGSLGIISYEWANNIPFYQIYEKDEIELFVKAHGGDPDAYCFFENRYAIDCEGVLTREEKKAVTLREAMNGITLFIDHEELSSLGFIALFSDGVSQFTNLKVLEAVREFMSFKSFKGSFVKRRMIRGMRNLKSQEKIPLDDISCAVLRIEKGEKNEDTERHKTDIG